MSASIENLPPETILHHILPFLSIPDIKNLSMTNRAFNKEYKESIIKSDWLWRQKADEIGLLVHNDATDVYCIVRHTLKRFYKYTYISRSGLKLDCSRDYSTKIKPINDKQIKRIAGLIEYLKLLSVAIFWKELLCRIKVSKEEYDKYIPRPTTCPAPLFLNFQSEGFTKLQEKLDLWLDEKKSEIEEIQSLAPLRFDRFLFSMPYIPSSLDKLKNLKIINLYCGLVFLPDSIGNLSFLEELNLNNNKLAFLPKTLGKLKNLKILLLKNNLLKSLFVSIGKLESLKKLDIENNRLKALPESINKLSNLQEISLSNNYLKIFPNIIFSSSIKVDGMDTQKEKQKKYGYTEIFGIKIQKSKDTAKKIAIPLIVGIGFFCAYKILK